MGDHVIHFDNSVKLTPTMANGQSVAVPDDWFVDVWWRDRAGKVHHKGIGVRCDQLAREPRATAEPKAIVIAIKSLMFRNGEAVTEARACRLFEHDLYRTKSQERSPEHGLITKGWFR